MTTEAKTQEPLSFDELITLGEGVEFAQVKFGNGKTARIGSLTAEQVAEWEEIRNSANGSKVAAALLISRSLVDGKGARIGIVKPYKEFTSDDHATLGRLAKAQARYQESLLFAINKLNLLTASAKQEAAAKND